MSSLCLQALQAGQMPVSGAHARGLHFLKSTIARLFAMVFKAQCFRQSVAGVLPDELQEFEHPKSLGVGQISQPA